MALTSGLYDIFTNAFPAHAHGFRPVLHFASGRRQRSPAHRGERHEIVPGEPRPLLHALQGGHPPRDSQLPASGVLHGGYQVVGFHYPLAALRKNPADYLLPGNVEVQCPHDVHPVGIYEEAKRCAYAGVDVQKLVSAVAPIVPVSHVDDATVADLPHKILGHPFDRLVGEAHAQRGSTGKRGYLSYLLARKADQALGVVRETAVEHPDRFRAAGDVLLKHYVGFVRWPGLLVSFEQFCCVVDDGYALHLRALLRMPVRDTLHDDREDGAPGEGGDVAFGGRKRRRRCRDAQSIAEKVQLLLAAQRPGQSGRLVREEETFLQLLRVVRNEYRAPVVDGYQDGLAPDPLSELQQGIDRELGRSVLIPVDPFVHVARQGCRRPGLPVYPVDPDTKPPGAPRDAQATMVVDRCELHYHDGGQHVAYSDHGALCPALPSNAIACTASEA